MTFLEAQQALCRKLDIDYADIANNNLFTLTDIKDYLIQGAMQAWDYAFWDFAEHAKTSVLSSTDIANGYIVYPPDIAPSTIYYLTIAGKEYKKKSFPTYQRWFENRPTDTEKIWAEFKRLIFFNTNIASVGTDMDIYGKRVFIQPTADADLMPFSPDTDAYEYSGNQACVLLAYAEALSSEKKKNPKQADVERNKAYGILSALSAQLKEGRASEQDKDNPMFKVPDFFRGRRGRGENTIGTFNE